MKYKGKLHTVARHSTTATVQTAPGNTGSCIPKLLFSTKLQQPPGAALSQE